MEHNKFTDLHTHTTFSQLDGMVKIQDYIQFAKENGLKAISMTDHGNIDGAIDFYKACHEAEIKPIIGSEFYFSMGVNDENADESVKKNFHLILLAKNLTGYKNLIKLTTYANIENFYRKPRITLEKIKEYSDGLICSTACVGSIWGYYLNNGMTKEAKDLLIEFKDIFGDDFYVEYNYHRIVDAERNISEKTYIENLYKLAKELKIKSIITNDTHYLYKEDEDVHKVLVCKGSGKTIFDNNRLDVYEHNYYKNLDEIKEIFLDFPQINVDKCVENIYEIIDKVEDYEIKFGEYIFPEFPTPNGESQREYLIKSIKNGLLKRFGTIKPSKEICNRLNYEFSVIDKMNFCGYFNIVSDYVNWAKDNDIVVGCGRGSGAGCLILYVLGITEVNPLDYDLLFERFLNPERVNFPDVDVDFESAKRPKVIEYLKEKYGVYGTVPISTKGYLKGKSAIKTVASKLGKDFVKFNSLLSPIKDPKVDTVDKIIEASPKIQKAYQTDNDWTEVIDMARKLEGNIQSTGIHAAGVIICHRDVSDIVPIVHTKDGLATGFSDKIVEKLGLIKYDLLGLKNLSIIDNCLKRINTKIDINNIPLNDKKTYELLQSGESNGIFQLESAGMKSLLKKLQPTNINHIDAIVALYRPGAMQFIDEYIENKQHVDSIEYFDKRVEPILKETYGQMVYQEQVMKIAQTLAGYTLGEADSLRKAIGKKLKDEMQKHKDKFIQGCVKGGMEK